MSRWIEKLLFCIFLLPLTAIAIAGEVTEGGQVYPNVWSWKNINRIYSQEGKRLFLTPLGSADYLTETLVEKRQNGKKKWISEFHTLFGGKKVSFASLDKINGRLIFSDGEDLKISSFPEKYSNSESGENYDLLRRRWNDFEILAKYPDGSLIGTELLANADSGNRFPCDSVRRGIVALDGTGKVLWRRTYVKIEKVEAVNYECKVWNKLGVLINHTAIFPLDDETILINFGLDWIRISLLSGSSPMLPGNIRGADTENFLSFRRSVIENFNQPMDWNCKNSEQCEEIETEYAYHKFLQYFFFPKLINKIR